MFLAEVIGTVVSPIQIPILDTQRLLLLRPVGPEGDPRGIARIGIDRVGAGPGDRVLVIDEGNSARQVLSNPEGAVKTLVVAFVDYVELNGSLVHDHRDA